MVNRIITHLNDIFLLDGVGGGILDGGWVSY